MKERTKEGKKRTKETYETRKEKDGKKRKMIERKRKKENAFRLQIMKGDSFFFGILLKNTFLYVYGAFMKTIKDRKKNRNLKKTGDAYSKQNLNACYAKLDTVIYNFNIKMNSVWILLQKYIKERIICWLVLKQLTFYG